MNAEQQKALDELEVQFGEATFWEEELTDSEVLVHAWFDNSVYVEIWSEPLEETGTIVDQPCLRDLYQEELLELVTRMYKDLGDSDVVVTVENAFELYDAGLADVAKKQKIVQLAC